MLATASIPVLDYIHISICLKGHNQPDLSRLAFGGIDRHGREKRLLQRANSIEITFDKHTQILILKGSIPYFWQGHNYTFTDEQFIEAIYYIGETIGIDLWQAAVHEFEYGVIMEVPYPPKEYIRNHRERERKFLKHDNPKHNGHFRRFEDKYVRLKIYDAGKNIKNKHGLSKRKALEQLGWDAGGHYIKVELHYLKPHLTFNHGRDLLLRDLIDPTWQARFKEDLLCQYGRLQPAQSLNAPAEKGDAFLSDILMHELVVRAINAGETIDELQNSLASRINTEYPDIFTKPNKDYRKGQVRKLLAKTSSLLSDNSKWDLSELLAEATKDR